MTLRITIIVSALFFTCSSLRAQSGELAEQDTITIQKQQALDSIRVTATTSLEALQQSRDSVSQAAAGRVASLQFKLDSVRSLGLEDHQLAQQVDSINRWREEKLATIQRSAEKLRDHTTGKIQSLALPPSLQEKVNELTSTFNRFDASLPGVGMPAVAVLPDVTIPAMPDIGLAGNLPSPGELPAVPGDVAKTIEEQAMQIDVVKDLQQEVVSTDALKEMSQSLQDPNALKEKALTEMQNAAVNHFAGQEQSLQNAMELLAKYKRKYPSVQSLADLSKKKPNELKGKPFIERVVPGVTFQLHRRTDWMLDVYPYAGYRFNPRLTAGMGWNHRVAYDFNRHAWNTDRRIFGPRVFGEYRVTDGLSGHIETEYMNTHVPPMFSSRRHDPQGREWVFSAMVGLKKEYRFAGKVKGTMLVLYNLHDPHHRSPYADRLNMRFGFEFPVKKKVKS